MKKLRPPSEIRDEAVRLALHASVERAKDGDPEGASVIRDLAWQIKQISLFKSALPHPSQPTE